MLLSCRGFSRNKPNEIAGRSGLFQRGQTQVLSSITLGTVGATPLSGVLAGAAVALVASDDAEWITGHALVVDGGFRAGKPWRKQAKWLTEPHPIRLYRPEGR